MPDLSPVNNPFLTDLLGLQQDGRQAISAPTNWTQSKPLLQVSTDLDPVIAELAASCLVRDTNTIGRWHFFIGSPGNGKSAAVGQLVRLLIQEHHCSVTDDHGTDISELANDSVPYSLDVLEQGCHFTSARIVQDASVVRNPYATDVDPARDLLDTLQQAWEQGISLIVCTNRGVLEKAFRDTYLDASVNQRTWHKAILRPLADPISEFGIAPQSIILPEEHLVFSSIKVSRSILDNRSLILGGSGIFEELILQASQADGWAVCAECTVMELCPLRANRDWLADGTGRQRVVTAFRRAEVLSSQVIVFREALAVISFLLAGCARDYHGIHPCEWVRRAAAVNDIFGLATRRIYMSLFSSGYPRGLEVSPILQAFQIKSLRILRDALPPGAPKDALASTLDEAAPSTDVGTSRLLGNEGVFCHLDALLGPLPSSFYDEWDGRYDRIRELGLPFVSELERRCADVWFALENAAENMPSHVAADVYWAVRRWSTQFTLHLGALVGDIAYAADQVDEFAELLELLSKKKDELAISERRRLRELEQLVERLLNRNPDEHGSMSNVSLAENVQVTGRWIESEMRPRVHQSPGSGSLAIAVHFGKSNDYAMLGAQMYLWLKQRASGTMDPHCVPDHLLDEAMDAKARAVAKSTYAFALDDISLTVEGERESFILTRLGGEVDVDAKDRP